MEPLIVASAANDLDIEERVFREFDHCRVGVGANSWTVQVYGVHWFEHEGWIQLGPADGGEESVLVHVWADTTPDQVKSALTRWARLAADERPARIDAPRILMN